VTRLFLALIAAVTIFAPTYVVAQEFTAAQKEQIQKMFKEYLMNNGEVVLDSVNKYQGELVEKEREEANNQKNVSALKKIAKDLDLDVDQLEKDKDSKKIADMLEKNIADAQALKHRKFQMDASQRRKSKGRIPDL